MNIKMQEEITNLQTHVVSMRQKYIPAITKHEEQNKRIQLKLLEKKEFKCKEMEELPEMIVKENLLDLVNINTPPLDPIEINAIKVKLRDFSKIIQHKINKKKCEIFTEIEFQ